MIKKNAGAPTTAKTAQRQHERTRGTLDTGTPERGVPVAQKRWSMSCAYGFIVFLTWAVRLLLSVWISSRKKKKKNVLRIELQKRHYFCCSFLQMEMLRSTPHVSVVIAVLLSRNSAMCLRRPASAPQAHTDVPQFTLLTCVRMV